MTITINGTTGIAGVDGSASTPAFKGNDADTGLFYPTANEVAAAAGGSAVWNASSTFGFKNRLINGEMDIDQRNNGASVSNGVGATAALPVDRWNLYGSQASKCTGQRNAGSVTPPTGYTNYLGVTSSSAYSVLTGDYFNIYQRIEGFNVADLGWGTANAQPITLSFWVRSSLTGTFSGSVHNGAFNRSYVFSYTINAANTWEFKTVTITGDTTGTWATNNTTGISLNFNLGTGSTYSGTAGSWVGSGLFAATGSVSVVGTNGATFYITGVQLERGSTATSFDFRPYGTELMLCQRYFQTDYVMQQGTFGYFLSYYGGTNAVTPISQTQVPMRTTPTASLSSTSIEYYSYSGVWTSTTLQIAAYSPSTFFAFSASDGDGRGKLMRTGSGGTAPAPYYLLDAEM